MSPFETGSLVALPAVLRAVIEDPGATTQVAAAGTVFIATNALDAGAAVVTAGVARAFVVAPDGRRLTVRYARPGAIVGSMGASPAGTRRPVGVEAVTECHFVMIDFAVIRKQLATDPQASIDLLQQLQATLDETYVLSATNAFGSIRERIATHLLDSATELHGGHRIVASVTQAELAESVGTAREVVARGLAAFRAEGTVATSRGQIQLLDIDRLAALAGRTRPSGALLRQDVAVQGPPSRRVERRRAATATAGQLRVLVIDDEEDVLAIVRALLSEVLPDVFVGWAPGAVAGAAMAMAAQWDVLIVDQALGDGTGVELLQRLAAGGSITPAIMLTGSIERSTDLAAMAAGAVDFVSKPHLDGRALARAVRYAVAGSRSLASARRDTAHARSESLTDVLTGVGNRRRFEAELDAAANGGPYTLVMADVDGLKSINDGFGHPAGDAALRAIATAFANRVRETDRVSRIGGDEFGAIIVGDDAGKVAERWSARIRVNIPGPGVVTAAVAVVQSHQRPSGEVVADADRRLRAAKGTGR